MDTFIALLALAVAVAAALYARAVRKDIADLMAALDRPKPIRQADSYRTLGDAP